MKPKVKMFRPVQQYRLDLPPNGLTMDMCVAEANKMFPRITFVKGKAIYYMPRGDLIVLRYGSITHFTRLGTSRLLRFGGRLESDP